MSYNESLRSLSLENLVIVGNNFLSSNHCLKHLNLPKLECCGNRFLSNNFITAEELLKKSGFQINCYFIHDSMTYLV